MGNESLQGGIMVKMNTGKELLEARGEAIDGRSEKGRPNLTRMGALEKGKVSLRQR
jgi:hypothetical protein